MAAISRINLSNMPFTPFSNMGSSACRTVDDRLLSTSSFQSQERIKKGLRMLISQAFHSRFIGGDRLDSAIGQGSPFFVGDKYVQVVPADHVIVIPPHDAADLIRNAACLGQ